MNSVKSTSQTLKYKRFIQSGDKNIWLRTFQFVAKAQFLWTTDSKLKIKEGFEPVPRQVNMFNNFLIITLLAS